MTFDGVKRSLSADDCVIADANGVAVGVAGIMGGATAEISPGTETVLLEAANFDPQEPRQRVSAWDCLARRVPGSNAGWT